MNIEEVKNNLIDVTQEMQDNFEKYLNGNDTVDMEQILFLKKQAKGNNVIAYRDLNLYIKNNYLKHVKVYRVSDKFHNRIKKIKLSDYKSENILEHRDFLSRYFKYNKVYVCIDERFKTLDYFHDVLFKQLFPIRRMGVLKMKILNKNFHLQ